jgi:hypothetical protein
MPRGSKMDGADMDTVIQAEKSKTENFKANTA